MTYTKPITTIIEERYSCRKHLKEPVADEILAQLKTYIADLEPPPFDGSARFKVVATTLEDSKALKSYGTYGFIKNPAGFIISAMKGSEKDLEDIGYQIEKIILHATDLGLGTCWLGGTFTKSPFVRDIALQADETMPIIVSFGYPAPKTPSGRIRQFAKGDRRLPWETLFFDEKPTQPLAAQKVGDYETPLKMLRIAPSASNKQPWRIVKKDDRFDFYLLRTPNYREGILSWLKLADLQRVDMGIAMSHFELSAREMGLGGSWQVLANQYQSSEMEYIVSWVRA